MYDLEAAILTRFHNLNPGQLFRFEYQAFPRSRGGGLRVARPSPRIRPREVSVSLGFGPSLDLVDVHSRIAVLNILTTESYMPLLGRLAFVHPLKFVRSSSCPC